MYPQNRESDVMNMDVPDDHLIMIDDLGLSRPRHTKISRVVKRKKVMADDYA